MAAEAPLLGAQEPVGSYGSSGSQTAAAESDPESAAADRHRATSFWAQVAFRPWHDSMDLPFYAPAGLAATMLAGFMLLIEDTHIKTAREMQTMNLTTPEEMEKLLANLTNATTPQGERRRYPIAEAIIGFLGANNTDTVVEAMDKANSQQGNSDTILSSLFIATVLVKFSLVFFYFVRSRAPKLLDLRSDALYGRGSSEETAAPWRQPEQTMRIPTQSTVKTPTELPPGLFAWLPALYRKTDEQLRKEAGYDALVLTRYCALGAKLCIWCMLPWGILLMTTYVYAGGSLWDCGRFSLANVPDGSVLLWFPLVTTYAITIAALKLLIDEQQVYTRMRHIFLIEKRVENYSIMLRDLRPENQTTERLRKYFEQMYESPLAASTDGLPKKSVFAVTVVTDCTKLIALQKQAATIRGASVINCTT
eukprot:SAG31_NODE_4738_length_2989_cov_1.405882_2_plen_422_part_00